MIDKFGKFFNPITLLVLNIFIILATEFYGNGYYFYQKGIIHIIAIAFIILAATRLFIRYYIFDRYIKRFLELSLLAMLIFAASHLVEFASYIIFKLPEGTIFINVANFYIISIILITVGVEFIIKNYQERSSLFIWLAGIAVLIFLVLTFAFINNGQMISIKPPSRLPMVYLLIVLIVSAIGFVNLLKLKKIISMLAPFINYLIAGLILIALAAIPNIFYETFENFGLPKFQIIYLSHFTFYAALSLMFLSFGQLLNLKGIYAAAREEAIRSQKNLISK